MPSCSVVPQLLKEDDGCDLILTDMQMPVVDGAEFARMAKTFYRKREKESPYIFFCSADYSCSLDEIADDVGVQGTYLRFLCPLESITESAGVVTDPCICQSICRCTPEAHYHHRPFFVSGQHVDSSHTRSLRCIAASSFFFRSAGDSHV